MRPVETINLFDTDLTIYEFGQHKELKPYLTQIVNDISTTNMNVNNTHHPDVYQSPPGLQINNAFKSLVESPEMIDFSNTRKQLTMLSEDRTFAIVEMWLTISPPKSMISLHRHYGLYHGMYFLHAPQGCGMLVLESDLPQSHFEKIGHVINNQYNSRTQTINMPEGGIFFIPSWMRHGSTANMTEDVRVSIDFIIDIVEK